MKDETKPQNEERKLDFQSSGDNQGDFKPQEDAIPKGYDFNGGDEKKKEDKKEEKNDKNNKMKPSEDNTINAPKVKKRKIKPNINPSEEEE